MTAPAPPIGTSCASSISSSSETSVSFLGVRRRLLPRCPNVTMGEPPVDDFLPVDSQPCGTSFLKRGRSCATQVTVMPTPGSAISVRVRTQAESVEVLVRWCFDVRRRGFGG